MTIKEIEDRINMLKMDYVRLQGDVEKLESVGGNIEAMERQLIKLETEIKELRMKKASLL